MAVTESSEAVTGQGAEDSTAAVPPLRLFGPRGRHRRPRPRKALLAAGGLALAAGALSLVRLTPESGLGGLGAPEAEPWADGDTDTGPSGTDRATNAAATVGPVPRVSPSATSAMGGLTTTPTASATLVPTPSATTAAPPPDPGTTTIPQAPNTPAPQPPRTTSPSTPQPPAAAPTPAPSRPAEPPSPQPSPSPTDRPGVCVPIIGLCVDPLTARHH
ncbi:hypothetical protein [Streptomyces sp. NPDC003635]